MENIKEIIAIVMMVFNFIFIMYVSYSLHMSLQEEKKFWKKQIEIADNLWKQTEEVAEGEDMSEQSNTNKE